MFHHQHCFPATATPPAQRSTQQSTAERRPMAQCQQPPRRLLAPDKGPVLRQDMRAPCPTKRADNSPCPASSHPEHAPPLPRLTSLYSSLEHSYSFFLRFSPLCLLPPPETVQRRPSCVTHHHYIIFKAFPTITITIPITGLSHLHYIITIGISLS